MGCTLNLNSAEDCRDTPCRSCTANEPARVQSPHRVIYLQYDPEACDEITWCQDQIDEKDTTYWRDDVVRELAEEQRDNHRFSCHWCPKGNGGSCADYYSSDRQKFCCECSACKLAREILTHKPE